jgi:hypothetical protein
LPLGLRLKKGHDAMKKVILAIAALLANSAVAHGATASSSVASGAARATVANALKIVHPVGAGLNFGIFSAGTGGTVVVSQSGVGSITGDIGLVAGNAVSRDSFTISGDTTRGFAITTSSGNTVSKGGATPATMAFSLSTPATATLVAGSYTLPVGGTLIVGNAQSPGAYTGTYTVTVTYQ